MDEEENVFEELTYEKYVELRRAALSLIDDENSKQSQKRATKCYTAFLMMVMKYPAYFGFKSQWQAAKTISAYDRKFKDEVKKNG